jgi:hypothetical protein
MRPQRSRIPALVCAVVLILVAIPDRAPQATQILYRTPEQLGVQSSLVVRGTVASTRSFWNDRHTKIFTEVSVDVAETYKGSGLGTIRLRQLGGTVDGVKVTVDGALQWRTDEEVLLFLEPYLAGSYHVSGFSQGKYDVERDTATGRAYVRRSVTTGTELMGAPATDNARTERLPLEQFVQQALGRTGGVR